MAINKLTDVAIRNFKPRDKEYLKSDGGNLFVRVRSSGQKTWVYRYKDHAEKTCTLILGEYPLHGLAKARIWANEQTALRDNGLDPRQAKADRKEAIVSADLRTLGALLEGYVLALRKAGRVSADQVERELNRYIPPKMLSRPAHKISGEDIADLLRTFYEQDKERTAGKVRAYLSAAFAMAIRAKLSAKIPVHMKGFGVTVNPIDGIDYQATKARDRTLTDSELKAYYNRLGKLKNVDVRDLLRLSCLLGGQRITQLAIAQLVIKDGHDSIYILDSKGRNPDEAREHYLPLCDAARTLVQERGKRLFGVLATDAETMMKMCSSSVKRISASMIKDGLSTESFAMSDIRRTAEGRLKRFDISREMRAELLSHGRSGVQSRHYEHEAMLSEKTAILRLWEQFLLGLVASVEIDLADAN